MQENTQPQTNVTTMPNAGQGVGGMSGVGVPNTASMGGAVAQPANTGGAQMNTANMGGMSGLNGTPGGMNAATMGQTQAMPNVAVPGGTAVKATAARQAAEASTPTALPTAVKIETLLE